MGKVTKVLEMRECLFTYLLAAFVFEGRCSPFFPFLFRPYLFF